MIDKTLIIAEAGVNHNGSLDLAYKMIDKAIEANVDIIKFQTAIVENGISKYAKKAEYQEKNTGNAESQLEMCKKITLKFDDFIKINDYCKKKGIKFMSTPFDLESIDFLNSLGVDVFKIPSGEITNLPYLIKIGKLKKKVILSTGMSYLKEVETAIRILKENGTKDIILLHCTTEYPAPLEDINLDAMITMKKEFGLEVGYSDHTKGILVPQLAVAMGAKVIEKHFTLDRQMEGPDHKASLEPDELKEMVDSIRLVEKIKGDGIKKPAMSELKNIQIARKSIVAKKDIQKGEFFTEDNITVKRPGDGISPMKWFEVLGKKAEKNYKEDELI